jgi:predicted MFS family arabinose efflux permease
MALLLACATIPVALFREPASPHRDPRARASLAAALHMVRRPGMPLWLGLVGFYKLGDAIAATMVRPMLVDAGYSLSELGLVLGSVGSAAGLLGAMTGGAIASRFGRARALWVCGLVHAVLLVLYALPALGVIGHGAMLALAVIEYITGGMATVALFTIMMDASDPRTGATDYTVQASVVVLVTGVGAAVSGYLAKAAGYPVHFAVCAVIAALGVVAMGVALRRGVVPPALPARDVPSTSHGSPAAIPTGGV